MPTVRRVLIPTDFTACADRAVAHGLVLARQHDAEVHLLHVLEGVVGDTFPGMPNLRDVYRHLREVAHTMMRTILRDGLVVRQAVVEGEPPSGIVDYAARHQIGLCTEGRQGCERLQRPCLPALAS